MRRHFVRFLFIFLLVVGLSGSAGDVSNSEVSKISYKSLIGNDFNSHNRAAKRTLLSLSNEHDTALVAALDGTIYLIEPKSRKVLWSFTSGSSIYSSYQAPVNHDNDTENVSGPGGGYFIDCGDDWELYAHNRLGKVKIPSTVEDFLKIMPHVDENGGVVVGSKITTVFLVDAKTGRLIHTYSSSDSTPTLQTNEEKSVLYNPAIEETGQSGSTDWKTGEMPLYITRKDYSLKSFVPKSDKVLWNLTFSEIEAAFLCQDIENSVSGLHPDSGYELPSEPDARFNMPLACQSRAVVYRFRSHNMLETLHSPKMLPKVHGGDVMLPESASLPMLPSQPKIDQVLEFHHTSPNLLLPSPLNANELLDSPDHDNSDTMTSLPQLTDYSAIAGVQVVQMPNNDGLRILSEGSRILSLVPFVTILVGLVTYRCIVVARKQVELAKQPRNLNTRAVPSKKKKIRKSGKNSGIGEGKEKITLSDVGDGYASIESDNKLQLNLNQSADGSIDGRTVGKLFVSNTEIAKGSNGTIVLEGIYEGRPVAVKRLVKAHHDVAFKEIQNLIASDHHPNIVRWYGVENNQDFVYLALERCACSLNDLIQLYSDSFGSPVCTEDQTTKTMIEYKVHLSSMKGITQDIKLWKANGYPSPTLLKLMRNIVSGLVHLHELGIIHRDLKPQNVLIIKERSLCAKLSDMGISKRLVGNMSSLGHHATGCGSSGWQAPEQLLHGRQTRAVDTFSLGCLLFYCITGGRHPFGESLERDMNIAKNKVDLFLVENIPEAVDLISRLLDPNAELRPKALEVLHHPLFWSSETRLSFLRDASDRVELEDRETNSDILKALESIAPTALGGKWDEKMEAAFINNIGRYRRYKFDSVRDLLRVMRNKLNHYRELPIEIQEILGPVPEGFDDYFAIRFPKLFIEVYKVMFEYCSEEEFFHKYFKSNNTQ
ncbi:serine/threonine-protein kinase/endoribonuclease IRE1a [Cornus florida]|uniref:serine/threonine-protein kinase/endoribonuclease IRE1a n=1 Tax=Cornus florida TaxID=4283 RepID=UPI00289BBC1C|nr:serine/threonine-protein kinase/endoribonuclease IRE1a [Cornus florida]